MNPQNQKALEILVQRQILDPYRTLGSFVSGKIILSQTLPHSFAVPTRDSYKIYSDALAIKVVSPPLPGKVQSVLSYNENSYVKVARKVIKMKYHHIVKEWTIPDQEKSTGESILMKFDNIILLGEGRRIYVIDENESSDKQIEFYELKEHFKGMIHPVTYINKMVVYNSSSITLVNPLSRKTLYEYPALRKYLKENELEIVTAESSKLVNIIALSLSNGEILIFNLKKDEIVFKVKVKSPAICIAFCDEETMMATSDETGNVILWDLENKKILYKFEEFIEGAIDSLLFVPGQPILTCGSSIQNCIKQLRINLQDNRILTLFRERVGITQRIEKIQLLNNNELVISSKNESMFTSLYSHTNNYKLNRALDSSSPYHIISRHFSVQLFKNQTMEKSFNIHESAYLGKISLSQKYYIVATKTRLIKLGVSGVEIKMTGIREIALFQEHFIFVLTDYDIIVLDFATFQVIKQLKVGKCSNSVINQFGSNFLLYLDLLGLYNHQKSSLQVWDMEKNQLAREFPLSQSNQAKCLSFSSDNKYLLSSHQKILNIWSVVHNNLFKSFNLENNIVYMTFTEDNQFFLSVFENERQINIWNNYIGKISSNRDDQNLSYNVVINHCEEDFRVFLKRKENNLLMKHEEEADQETQLNLGDEILSSIPDSEDNIPEYKFEATQKWLPLIYYDDIKERNTIQNSKEISLPFFLDFKNIDEEKKKMQQEIKQDLINKKNQRQQKIDKHLKDDSHQINITQESTPQQFLKCIRTLETLSIAQVDYQLRTFLLNPSNKTSLLKMFSWLFTDCQTSHKISQQFVNIVFHRTLYLIGTEIFDEDLKEIVAHVNNGYRARIQPQKHKVDRCIAITEKLM